MGVSRTTKKRRGGGNIFLLTSSSGSRSICRSPPSSLPLAGISSIPAEATSPLWCAPFPLANAHEPYSSRRVRPLLPQPFRTRILPFPRPEPQQHNFQCRTQGEGWLVIVDDSTEILLLNPLSGGRIPLPPCMKRVRKVVLSARPSPGSKFSAVLISEEGTLAFAGEGDEAWTPIRADTSTMIFHDVVHHDGHFVTVSADACSDHRSNLQVFDITTITSSAYASGSVTRDSSLRLQQIPRPCLSGVVSLRTAADPRIQRF